MTDPKVNRESNWQKILQRIRTMREESLAESGQGGGEVETGIPPEEVESVGLNPRMQQIREAQKKVGSLKYEDRTEDHPSIK